MPSNTSSTALAIGLTAFGLGLAFAGVWYYRRKRASRAANALQTDEGGESPTGDEEPIQREKLGGGQEGPYDLVTNPSQENLLLEFFAVVFALSVPFWLVGEKRLPLPMDLPVSALTFVNPMIAAAVLTYRRKGSGGLKQLFKKSFDAQKIKNKLWYVPILLLLPILYFLSYGFMRLLDMPLPDPNIPWLMVPAFFILFFIGAMGEELGWTGYAIDPMQKRWGALKASILLGLVWGLIHVIPDIQNQKTADWILWQRLYSVAFRILIVWIYNNTGRSVLAAILIHTMDNVSVFLFPNYGSHYNPLITCLLSWLTAVMVIIGWGPKTLARYRFVSASRV